jgi:hypothetical protein
MPLTHALYPSSEQHSVAPLLFPAQSEAAAQTWSCKSPEQVVTGVKGQDVPQ